MMFRKLALQIPLILLLLISFTVDGFSQGQKAYRYLSDFSYLTKDKRTEDEKAEDFIQALKRGDRRAFQVVEYDVLLRVVVRLKKEADEILKKEDPTKVGFLKAFLMQWGGDSVRNRATLVQSTLSGIFNLDPRVRLVAASWLRNLRPDTTMMRAVKLAVGVDVQVIRYDRATDDFVFTHPRILETVASWEEYYREKDIDYPGVFAPGNIETRAIGDHNTINRIGGQGTNAHLKNKYNNDASTTSADYIVTGLDARRWGAPNTYDADRKWEKALPRTGAPTVNAGDTPSQRPSSLGDYYQRLNAALNMAYNGIKQNQILPNGKVFSEHIYGIGNTTNITRCVIPNTDPLQVYDNIPTNRCELLKDQAAINSKSLNTRFPGHTIQLKPVAGRSVNARITGNDLEALVDHRDVYRYYPDMTKDGNTLKNLSQSQRQKMELLLHQNWQQGTRVPVGQGRMYVYVNAYGELVIGNPWVELTKLDMFIARFAWYQKIKAGYRNILAIMSKDTCAVQYLSIDGESPDVIPFLSTAGPTPMFDYRDVPVFLEGLRKNKVVSCRYAIMRVLKDIYEQKPPRAPLTPPEVQREINIALWEQKRENFRSDIETGKIFHRESITVGKAPARPTYVPPLATGGGTTGTLAVATDLDPYGPLGGDTGTSAARKLDLGFALPNDEILANSNRAIVSDYDLNSTSPVATKVDSRVAYSLDRLFKQRFYLLIGPDNKRRDYYEDRADYSRLWNDARMSLMLADMPANLGGTTGNTWWGAAKGNQAVSPDTRPVEPLVAADMKRLAGTDFNKFAPGTVSSNHKAVVANNVTFWEAAQYVDSLVVYNIERMKKAQNLIDEILKGNKRAFMEAKWDDVESMIILTLKRLETIHRDPARQATLNRENPQNVLGGANGPVNYSAKPEFTFFDVFKKYKVVKSYNSSDIYTAKKYSRTAAATYREDVTGGQKIQIKRKQAFIPIVEQVKNVTTRTYSEDKRKKIIQAAMGGLFNKDPRIRLTAIHFLRRLGPDEAMLAEIEKARMINSTTGSSVDSPPESTDYRSAFIDTHTYRRFGNDTSDIKGELSDYLLVTRHRYEGALDLDVEQRARDWNSYKVYLNTLPTTALYRERIPHPNYDPRRNEFNRVVRLPAEGGGNAVRYARFYGFYQLKAPSEELEKLYKFIRRQQLVKAVKRGDVKTVSNMTRSEFTILAEAIDHEWRGYVPFQSFHSVASKFAKPGLKTPSDLAVFSGKDVRVIKHGIDNRNFLVQKGTAEFLVRFYNFYDMCTDFRTRGTVKGCTNGKGYEPNGTYKKEVRDAMYFYIQDDIVVQEFELAFNGENPDGRAVIRAGSDLSMHLNPGGERVYLSLPERIRKDIRDAVWGDYERLPEELKYILGIISTRAPRADVLTYHNVMLGLAPRIPAGDAGEQLYN